MGRSLLYVAIVAGVIVSFGWLEAGRRARGHAKGVGTPPVGEVTIADPSHHWKTGGFAQMTPPIYLPSSDGKERIEVWLRVPVGSRIRVIARPGVEPTLSYPPDTVADRIDLRDGDDRASVSDVRGTRFVEGGEIFHVYRRLGGAGLSGFEWPRGNPV